MRLLVCRNPQLELQAMAEKKYDIHVDFKKHSIYYAHLKGVVFQDVASLLTFFANKFLSSHMDSTVWTITPQQHQIPTSLHMLPATFITMNYIHFLRPGRVPSAAALAAAKKKRYYNKLHSFIAARASPECCRKKKREMLAPVAPVAPVAPKSSACRLRIV
jgi:hypothetical protein